MASKKDYPSMDDVALFKAAQKGDMQAFEELVGRHRDKIYARAFSMMRNEDDATDLSQEAWVKAWQRLKQFQGESSFLTWMTRIMIHEAFAILRRRRRLSQFDDLDDTGTVHHLALMARGRNPEQQAIDGELRLALAQALSMLPEPYRIVFTLREIDEVSTSDAAGMLGITEECVRIRLHRARALLRRRLAKRVATVKPGPRCRPRPVD